MRRATAALALTLIGIGLVPPTAASAAVRPTTGLWLSADQVAALPTSGAAWSAVKAAADAAPGVPSLADQDSDHDVRTLAAALVAARTGDAGYRAKAAAGIVAAIGTEAGGRTLALGRNLVSYVVAADLVDLRNADPAGDSRFRTWLAGVRRAPLDGATLVSTHERRPNNWGTHAGASRVAASAYLGDRADLDRAAAVFRGWTGERGAYAGFDFGDLSWQINPLAPVGVNPGPSPTLLGLDIGGALPEEMRRGCGLQLPPCATGYPWGALSGAAVQAQLLARQGYDAWAWGDQAVRRATQFLWDLNGRFGGWWASGDDAFVPALVDAAYGATFPVDAGAGPGKNFGFTAWTHPGPGAGRGVAGAVPAPPAPVPAPKRPAARIAGADRYATAVALSAATFAPGVAEVRVATGGSFADALAAGPAAAVAGGPVLLVAPTGVPRTVADELRRLRPGRVVVAGGPGAVPDAVLHAIRTIVPDVSRVAGADRYETAALGSRTAFPSGAAVAYLATGAEWADALSAGAAAALRGGPVLLASADGVPASTAAELARLRPAEVVVVGGTRALPRGVADAAAAATGARVRRIAGADRYETAALVTRDASPAPGGTVLVASGESFADALTAGPTRRPLLLTPMGGTSPAVVSEIARRQPERVEVLGGTSAVSSLVEALLRAA